MAVNYPRTVHHPDPNVGATYTVASKEAEDQWVAAGWRLTPPGEAEDKKAPEAEKKS